MQPKNLQTDYETYLEVMEDLLNPIDARGLDLETLKRLYESKFVYLENLRIKCFFEINNNPHTRFNQEDYNIILIALKETKTQVKKLFLLAINNNLSNRKVS